MRTLAFVMALMVSLPALPEAGMIPFDSRPGPIGGQGHWYTLRTMKGDDFWLDPSSVTDIRYDEETETYHIAGEPPIAIAIVLHPDFYRDDEPWRHAIDWVRQAEQIFRNSGVPIRFVINHISTRENLPDTIESAYHSISGSEYAEYGVDMLVVLMPTTGYDRYCGVAAIGSPDYYGGVIHSVSACGPEVLAHEMGHNFGLYHDFDISEPFELPPAQPKPGGYCIVGESGSMDTCSLGTIMSYASERVPFFANRNFEYDDEPLGDDLHDAVEHLNKVKTGRALAWELDQRRDYSPQTKPTFEVIYD